MSTPLLETKLFLPRPRKGLVLRPRLRERLQQGLAAKLMLVSAPAGFGKTTLLVDWMAAVSASPGADISTAWVSLDASDNDPATYWTYVITALRTVAPDVGAEALGLLQESQPPSIQLVLTTLLNDLGAAEVEVVLVLDDYHVVDSIEVQAGMAFLLDHLPPRLHLVIASRADPALPLSRLRSRGDLVEIRASDLRFTPDEAESYLNDGMGLQLTPDDVTSLEERTEGWIAALQLAALSMTGRDDVASFIAGFAGDDRYVVDYLVEEVLQRLPEDVQDFLLQTSVLDRMTGSLCDALTGQDGGRAVLEALDRDNLFLVPLDDRRQWYRYHHLFADVLQARLLDEQPRRVGDLHRLASSWFQDHGDPAEAIRHAVAGGDFGSAAALMELQMPTMQRDRRETTIRGWLEGLPAEVLRVRPVLCNDLAGARLSTGTIEGVDELLDDAERWLDATEGGTGRRPTWSSWTRTSSDGCRPRSPSTAPGWPSCGATSTPRCASLSARSTSLWRTTTSHVVPRPPCGGWRRGRLATSRWRTRRTPRAWSTSSGSTTSPTCSAAPSGSPTCRSPRVVYVQPSAPLSTPWSSPPATAAECCGARWTCTSAWPRCTGSLATWRPPGVT